MDKCPNFNLFKGEVTSRRLLSVLYSPLRTLSNTADMSAAGIRAMSSLSLSPEESLMILNNAGAHLADCIACLQYEPSHGAEGRMCARARAEQEQMAGLIQSIQQNMGTQ